MKEGKIMIINFKGVFSIDEHIRILRAVSNWNLKAITIINKDDQFQYEIPITNSQPLTSN